MPLMILSSSYKRRLSLNLNTTPLKAYYFSNNILGQQIMNVWYIRESAPITAQSYGCYLSDYVYKGTSGLHPAFHTFLWYHYGFALFSLEYHAETSGHKDKESSPTAEFI